MTNKYPGKCSICSCSVAAAEGHAVKTDAGKWEVRCRAHVGGAAAVSGAAVVSAASRTITVERVGRRSYLRGDTLAVRGLLRDGGCHWDADARAWWIGDAATAEMLAASARTAPAESAPKKRITHCVGCGGSLDRFQLARGFKFCSQDCAIDRRMGGRSGYVNGSWHQGSED